MDNCLRRMAESLVLGDLGDCSQNLLASKDNDTECNGSMNMYLLSVTCVFKKNPF